MGHHADAEECNEESIGWQARLVLEDAPFDGARLEVAVAPAALLRFFGRHRLKIGTKLIVCRLSLMTC